MATGALQAEVTSGSGERAPAGVWLRRYAWFVVVYSVLVVLWGVVVRATGSGNGCGDHWPLCNGQVFPIHPRLATVIEYTHRMMSGPSEVPLIILLVVWVFRATPKRHLARSFAVAGLLLILTEGLLGALLVKLGLTAMSTSPWRPPMLALHLSNTLLLLGSLALTAHFLGRRSAMLRGFVEFRAQSAGGGWTAGSDGDWGDRIAGSAGGYALPFRFAAERTDGGFFFFGGVAGAAADSASGERDCRGHVHFVAAVAGGVCGARWRASHAGVVAGRVAGISVSAGRAGCAAARAGVDAGAAPGGGGCFLVCAGGADSRHNYHRGKITPP